MSESSLPVEAIIMERQPASAPQGQELDCPPVLSLGGMRWVRKWLEELIGKNQVGPHGPFDYTATTPEMVQHILADDFKELLTPSHLIVCPNGSHGEVTPQHKFYKDISLEALGGMVGLD